MAETFWNGEPCEARRVVVVIGKAMRPTWWCADLEGQERTVVEVQQHGSAFYLDDEDGSGWAKVTEGRGSPWWGHRSVPVERVVRDAQPGKGEGIHTKDKLADALEKAGLRQMAKKARTGWYHDYLSPLATPDMQLLSDLRDAEAKGNIAAKALIARHMNGDFDATKEESDDWAASPEGRAAFDALPMEMRVALGDPRCRN